MSIPPERWLLPIAIICLFSTRGISGAGEYDAKIKPLLKERCFACHGALQQQSGLRLDAGSFIRQGGDNGAAVVPGDPSASLLIQKVSSVDDAVRMPPDGERLTAEQIDLLRAWIQAGAPSPVDEQPEADPREHWAFRPVVRPEVPSALGKVWPRNPIDAFVAVEHERLGLVPQQEAPRTLLIRRLYLDLVGVPPTAEELATIAQDNRDGWYERLVDELLEDPRHGERWARHWMDVWRYSDWWGLGNQLRNSQQHIWHWRDWIVESLSEDLPYDEMVRLMLAADELHPDDPERLRATGFLARNFFLFNRHQWMDETVEHVSKAFLGLTMNCTKCHDHKYDPFVQTDFYRLRAFFEPYHVRTDIVPGQADLAIDGIPRAFDALPDEPTYRFIRGDENRPDKSQAIPPGIPELLAFDELTIEKVALPAAAWQPERQPWVIEAHLSAARGEVSAAETKLKSAQEKVAAALKKLDTLRTAAKPSGDADARPAESLPAVAEDFQTLDPQRWKLFGGEWVHMPGRLEQRQDGPQRAGLRWLGEAPRDFDATLRFTIIGGSRWRSVTIGFDATAPDPTAPASPTDHEQFVYVSGVQGGSKIQAAYRQAGNTAYPSDGMRSLPIELNREYTFRVQVRDTLINASLDGQPVLAWRTPIARRAGAMQLTTFDALAVIHGVNIGPLSPEVQLREPTSVPNGEPSTLAQAETLVADASAEQRVAATALDAAQAELESLRRRGEALRAAWASADAGGSDETLMSQELMLRTAAVKAERQASLAKAQHAAAEIELRLLRAGTDKRESIEKELQSALASVEKAKTTAAAEVTPNDHFAPIAGAKWSPTRFRSSGADDPTLTFPAHSSGRRKAFAQWLTDPRHPLTARVAVNHIWTRHLGTPLVPTMFEFGRHGTPPTHPELLDWLAAELVSNKWSMKHLHRLIVTSATYRLDSSAAGQEANLAIDRDNAHYWRRTPVRLESQVVRDSLLALAGTLDWTRGGPSVPIAQQAESKRRSLYFFHSNNEQNLFLTTFDEARVTECYRREQSIVPQQALAMSNSRLVLETAGPIAARIVAAVGVDSGAEGDLSFIRQAFTMILGMDATEAEAAAGLRAMDAWRRLPDGSDQSARTHFIWALLNHNDFVTLR